MADAPPPNPQPEPPLQFDRAVAAEGPSEPGASPLLCKSCEKPILDRYWKVRTAAICAACERAIRAAIRASPPGTTRGPFLRAAVFGSVAAGIGAGLYFAIVKLNCYEIGLVAIVVGLLVGKGVRLGTRGEGGRKGSCTKGDAPAWAGTSTGLRARHA